MANPDDIRSGLVDVASSIDVGDLDTARVDVHGIVRRRRMRNRVGAGLGVAALVAVGVIAFTALDQSDDPDMLVSADPTVVDTPDGTAPVESLAPVAVPPAPVEGTEQPGVVAGEGTPTEAQFAAPWRDGFVAWSLVYPPQPFPAELPAEFSALFPQEVIDLFAVDRPATIDEATKMLSEAGLLDEVSAIISANPEASAAIYGKPSSDPPTVAAQFTTDGTTWKPVDMTLPPGATDLAGVTTAGDRLAVVYNEPQTPEDPGTGTVTVATTTDLVNWTTQQVAPPAPPVELPTGFKRSVSGQGLVANESGWAVTVFESIDLDVLQLVPDDVRATIETSRGGFGSSTDSNGITIDYSFDVTSNTTKTVSFTWEELGVPPDVVPYVTDNEYRPRVWAAPWGGVPAPSDLETGPGQMLATPSGFLQWSNETLFSQDGLTWTASPLPDPDGYISSGFAFDGGVIALSTNQDGSVDLYRLDQTGGSPQLLDVPGLPDKFQSGLASRWAPGSARILDAADQAGTGGEGEEYVADTWLLASNDGERFVASDLDDAGGLGGPTEVVTNRKIALAQVGVLWTRIDLP